MCRLSTISMAHDIPGNRDEETHHRQEEETLDDDGARSSSVAAPAHYSARVPTPPPVKYLGNGKRRVHGYLM